MEDREARLARQPDDLKLRDDLAVAYEKTGQTERAIELMRDSLELDADRYETHANLGTFLIHDGQYQEGLKHIDRAIAINPDAHFGREKYQRWLVEYVVTRLGEDGKPRLPLRGFNDEGQLESGSFAGFLASKLDNKHRSLDPEQTRAAVKGVLGMMRFSDADSPVLLEALGDLLVMSKNGGPDDAKQLAAMAFLKTAHRVDDQTAKAQYRKLAAVALAMQQRKTWRGGTDVTVDQIDQALEAGLTRGRRLAAQIEADEQHWIVAGDDVEAKYDARYREPAATP